MPFSERFWSFYSLTYRSFLRLPMNNTWVCTEYCPWFTPTSGEFFECSDKSMCDIGSEGPSCCNGRGGRAKCRASAPVMCEDRLLFGGVPDYTCRSNDLNGCETTNRKCYDYGELISGDVWPYTKGKFKHLFLRCILF